MADDVEHAPLVLVQPPVDLGERRLHVFMATDREVIQARPPLAQSPGEAPQDEIPASGARQMRGKAGQRERHASAGTHDPQRRQRLADDSSPADAVRQEPHRLQCGERLQPQRLGAVLENLEELDRAGHNRRATARRPQCPHLLGGGHVVQDDQRPSTTEGVQVQLAPPVQVAGDVRRWDAEGQQPVIEGVGRCDRQPAVQGDEQLVVGILGSGEVMGEDQGQRRLADTGPPGNGCHWRFVPTSAENLKGAADLGAAAYERLGACWQFMPPDADGQRPTVRQPLPGRGASTTWRRPPRNRCASAQGGFGACRARRSPVAAHSLRNRGKGAERRTA